MVAISATGFTEQLHCFRGDLGMSEIYVLTDSRYAIREGRKARTNKEDLPMRVLKIRIS